MSELRPYQERGLRDIVSAWQQGHRAVLCVAPTGSGKTILLRELISRAQRVNHNLRVLFGCPWRELVRQGHEKLRERGIPAGIWMGPQRPKPGETVHVASIATAARGKPDRELTGHGLVVIDEAHRAATDSCRRILDRYPYARMLGLTATPIRLDGQPLSDIFDAVVTMATVAELTPQYLVPVRAYAPPRHVDLSRVRMHGADYESQSLDHAVNQTALVGDAVDHWLRLAQNRRTFAFCVSVAHAEHVVERFRARGVPAEVITGETSAKVRKALFEALQAGRLRVLCNVGVLTEGLDFPALGCIILLRPTLSVGLHLQILGRGLRPYPGKADCLVLDHADNLRKHGFPADERDWEAEAERLADARSGGELEDRARLCSRCGALVPMGKRCTCGPGAMSEPLEERIPITLAGQLVPLQAATMHHPR